MKKTLLATNPHLKNAAQREEALARNIESSSAIEGIWVKRDATTGRFLDRNPANSAAPPQEDLSITSTKSRVIG
jgi:hypothetical protein